MTLKSSGWSCFHSGLIWRWENGAEEQVGSSVWEKWRKHYMELTCRLGHRWHCSFKNDFNLRTLKPKGVPKHPPNGRPSCVVAWKRFQDFQLKIKITNSWFHCRNICTSAAAVTLTDSIRTCFQGSACSWQHRLKQQAVRWQLSDQTAEEFERTWIR